MIDMKSYVISDCNESKLRIASYFSSPNCNRYLMGDDMSLCYGNMVFKKLMMLPAK